MSDDVAEVLGSKLEKRWLEAVAAASAKSKMPSLLKVIVQEFGLRYLAYGLLFFSNDFIATLIRPILIGRMLSFFTSGGAVTSEDAFLYAVLLSFTFFLNGFLSDHYFIATQMYGVKVRVAVVSLVYRKCLRLSQSAFSDTSPGQIVNLISNDVARFEMVTLFVNTMWAAPIIATILFYILFTDVGAPGVIGFFLILLVLPFQAYNGKLSSVFRLQMAKKTDERVRLMEQIITGIQVIKLYAWEKPYQALVDSARRSELKKHRKAAYVRGVFMIFNMFTTRCALFCALLTVVLTGGELNVEMVFVLTSYLTTLAFLLTGLFVRGFAEVAECLVSIQRLQDFLLRDEYGSPIEYRTLKIPRPFRGEMFHNKTIGASNGKELYKKNREDGFINRAFVRGENDKSVHSVEMCGVKASWTPGSRELTLENINLKIQSGQLVGIIGTVGSGKSSLLQMLLGELQASHGVLRVKGSLSYASQEPWIFIGTVRQNILFGQEFNRKRYNKVTKVCCLEKDFEQLPKGDMTLVGERGVSLSGGQKARINLARAVYKDADIYLLDDPLSAVDAHVGKHLFNLCIEDFLGDKTRILVTHQVQHLSRADHLVLLNNNVIQQQGTIWELQNSGLDYAALMATEESIKSGSEGNRVAQFSRSISHASTMSFDSSMGMDEIDVDNDLNEDEGGKEHLTHISTKELYHGYIKSGMNYVGAVMIVFTFVFTQLLASVCDYWVSYWTSVEQKRHNYPEGGEIWSSFTYSVIHGVFVFSVFVAGVIRSLIFFESTLRCSRGLHKKMVKSVIGTYLSFFHKNPSGRILNRFAKDMGAVDEVLPKALMDVGQTFCQVLGSFIVTAYVNPWFLIPIVILATASMYLRQIFIRTSKNLKRIEGVARSPVYSHLNATLQGLTTIRANQSQSKLIKEFGEHQDRHTGSLFLFFNATSAFSFSLGMMSSAFNTIIILSFLFFHDNSYGSNVGLTITQIMSINLYMQWGMRMATEVTNQMTSCERLIEYTKFEPEENTENKHSLSPTWPTHGRIEMRHVYAKYTPDDTFVIKDLSLTILPKEKVGIVGRTGAGKSSLIGALFRLICLEGLISIDGVDIKTLTLEELRLKISIIPQDPILFSGTLRRNLDPFGRYPDELLWSALKEVEMKDFTTDMEGFSLDMKVMEGGSNFSVGQRQLVCLARAILRNNKILVLDEATANVDPQTDALIQKTIRRKFADQTVLTIAHRLNTIMDSDKVLVMDAGSLVEYDHPYKLLSNPHGHFFELVKQTGKSMTAHLIDLARDNYFKTMTARTENEGHAGP